MNIEKALDNILQLQSHLSGSGRPFLQEFTDNTGLTTESLVDQESINNTLDEIKKQICNKKFKDKVALIFGGTTGIGLQTAIELTKESIKTVVVCGRNLEKWKMSISSIDQKVVEYKQCDVRVYSQVEDVVKYVFNKYGRLDICFNNAGVQPTDTTDITETQLESYVDEDGSIIFKIPKFSCTSGRTPTSNVCENPIATTAIGVFNCLKAELTHIYQKQPKNLGVSIINTSSRNGILPDSHRPLYAASKAFVISLTKSVATQAAQKGLSLNRETPIRINCVAPGPILTPLEIPLFVPNVDPFVKLSESEYKQFNTIGAKGVPLGRTGMPWEVARGVLFLADEKMSSYITGTTIEIDGGYCSSPLLNILCLLSRES